MKKEMGINYPHLLQTSLQKTYDDWTIIDPKIFGRKLNTLLRTEEIRRVYHEATRAYEAIRRWEILELQGFSHYPQLIEPLDGEQYLLPCQMDSLDWRWNFGPGRPPVYHQYCLAMACHWRCKGDLAVAQRLMPDCSWVVVSHERHSMVCCPEHQLIFDMTYAAMGVSAQSALDTIFGEGLGGTDYEVYEPEEFGWTDHTRYIIKIWELVDGYPQDKRLEVIKGMGGQLDEYRSEETIDEPELVIAV